MICSPTYDNESILDKLICFTGKESYSRDMTKDYVSIVSNLEIHETLVKGFTKKFGNPVEVLNMPVQTGLGTLYLANPRFVLLLNATVPATGIVDLDWTVPPVFGIGLVGDYLEHALYLQALSGSLSNFDALGYH